MKKVRVEVVVLAVMLQRKDEDDDYRRETASKKNIRIKYVLSINIKPVRVET